MLAEYLKAEGGDPTPISVSEHLAVHSTDGVLSSSREI
jgi:hypothetical protein